MNITRIILLFGIIAAGFLFFNTPQQGAKKDRSVLVVGTSADYPPYEFIDSKTGTIVGFDIDVITDVASRLGKTIELKDMSFGSLILGLLSREIDVVAAGMSPTPRRRKFVSFTHHYLDSDAYVIVSLKDRFLPKSLQDLAGKNVVVNTGYTAEAYLDQQDIKLHLTRLQTPALALVALQCGSVDAFVCAQSTARAMIEKISNPDSIALCVLENTGDNCAFALSRYAAELTEEINSALDLMRCDGTLERLKEKWKLS
ncbi:MAG TPA: ABC transporter substrate-binding protein [Cellvibrio sp.]